MTYSSILYDRIISVKLISDTATIELPVNQGGVKPDITFSATLLPGSLFHEATLTIVNYKLPYDIRSYKRMEVTAGYRHQTYTEAKPDETITRVFPIEVFYSYCLSPAPNSRTVFKGIIVSSFAGQSKFFFTKSSAGYTLIFYKDVTVIEFIQTVVDTLIQDGYNIALQENIPAAVKNVVMRTGPRDGSNYGMQRKYRNVPHMLSEISPMLETAYKSIGKEGSFNVTFSEGKLIIFCTDGFYSTDEKIVKLESISSATLNAGIINVTAPWFPPLIPGNIIEVSRKYIDGSELPNVINLDEQMGTDNLYRVLTMTISFSTNGSENSMDITGIPLRYAEDNFADTTDEYQTQWSKQVKLAEKQKQEALDNQVALIQKDLFIKEDGTEETETETDSAPETVVHIGEIPEDQNPVHLYLKENKDIFSSFQIKTWGPAEYTRQLSDICAELYPDFPKLNDSVPDVIDKGFPPVMFDNQISGSYLWCIVYACTYLENKPEFALFKNSVQAVLAGKSVAYPVIKSWDDIKGPKFKGLFDAAAKLETLPGGYAAKHTMLNIGTMLEELA